MPTIGFSAPIKKTMRQWAVTFYDLGGGARIRGVWPQYFADVHGVIFVVDASDSERLEEAAKELHAALAHPMIVGKPTLMCVARVFGRARDPIYFSPTDEPATSRARLSFSNKADLPNSLDESSVSVAMRLDSLLLTRHSVVRCVATMPSTGAADARIALGLDWLLDAAGGDWGSLNERRQREMVEQKKIEDDRRAAQKAAYAAHVAAVEAKKVGGGAEGGAGGGAEGGAEGGATAAVVGAGSGLATTAAAPPAAAASPQCFRCKREPAARKCAASKWEAVCEKCAGTLEAMAAADAAAAADTDAVGGGRGVPITPSKVRSEVVSAPSSPEPRALETVHEAAVPSGGASAAASVSSVTQTPTTSVLLEPVGFISPPTADAPDEESTVVVVGGGTPALPPAGGGAGDFVVDAAEEDVVAATTAAASAASAADGAPASLLASFEAAAATQPTAAPVPTPTPTPSAPAASGGPSCATCKTGVAERKAAISAGVWAPVCGPCGDALDAGKPPLGNLLESVVHASLKTVFVTEDDATEGGAEATK